MSEMVFNAGGEGCHIYKNVFWITEGYKTPTSDVKDKINTLLFYLKEDQTLFSEILTVAAAAVIPAPWHLSSFIFSSSALPY